jgi:hypothetical protein
MKVGTRCVTRELETPELCRANHASSAHFARTLTRRFLQEKNKTSRHLDASSSAFKTPLHHPQLAELLPQA